MRTVFKIERFDSDTAIPEFFVTHIGMAQIYCGSVVALTMCQDGGNRLVPQVKMIWPLERMIEVNPVLARRCLGYTVPS